MAQGLDLNLTEEEHAALIEESTNRSTLLCSFGPGFVRLLDVQVNAWAIKRLGEMRA